MYSSKSFYYERLQSHLHPLNLFFLECSGTDKVDSTTVMIRIPVTFCHSAPPKSHFDLIFFFVAHFEFIKDGKAVELQGSINHSVQSRLQSLFAYSNIIWIEMYNYWIKIFPPIVNFCDSNKRNTLLDSCIAVCLWGLFYVFVTAHWQIWNNFITFLHSFLTTRFSK